MILILIGLFLILINFNLGITINEVEFSLDILPDLIGYILLWIGFTKASNRVEAFARGKAVVVAGLITSLISYLPLIKGYNFFTGTLVPLILIILALLVLKVINKGINELELKLGLDLGGVKFIGLFNILLVVAIIMMIGVFIKLELVILITRIASIIYIALCLLYLFNLAKVVKEVE